MLKKNIKNWFQAIRRGDFEEVATLVQTNKDYLMVCNFAPPKKDDGQSGLQVALKTGQFAIAELLIEKGADVSFQETSTVNDWIAPVLHNSIRATIFNTCLLQPDINRFDQAAALLQLMLRKGANPQAQDSYGNGSLHRALLDARQMLDHPQVASKQPLLLQQVKQVFAILLAVCADPAVATDKRPSATALADNFKLVSYQLL